MYGRLGRRLWLLFIVFALPSGVQAQTVTDGRVWTTLSLQGRPVTTSPWRWASDVTTRFRDGIDALDTLTARVMVLYDLTASANVGGGYVLSNAYPAGLGVTTEHRLFQQFQWQRRAGASTLALRTRLEERSVEGNSGWAVRVRQQLRYSRPLGASRLSLVGWDELFIHANATSRYARGVEQNRVFGGLGIALPAGPRLEAGYLNQFILGRAAPDRMNHVLALTVAAAF